MNNKRMPVIAGNWKMNLGLQEGNDLFLKIQDAHPSDRIKTIIFPQFLHLQDLIKQRKKKHIKIGAQNCNQLNNGAFTGEVSPSILKEMACQYCLVGHSERRALFYETDHDCLAKVKILLDHGIKPILCVGETAEDRQQGSHQDFVVQQITQVFSHLKRDEIEQIIIAYEPVWAIGTGLTATKEQVEEMHVCIREAVAHLSDQQCADTMPILYGGSVKAQNAPDLFQMQNIDGFLVGGASLDSEDFLSIINKVLLCLDSF